MKSAQLTSAFNNMVEQLRHKENDAQTFGPLYRPARRRGLIGRPADRNRRRAPA